LGKGESKIILSPTNEKKRDRRAKVDKNFCRQYGTKQKLKKTGKGQKGSGCSFKEVQGGKLLGGWWINKEMIIEVWGGTYFRRRPAGRVLGIRLN